MKYNKMEKWNFINWENWIKENLKLKIFPLRFMLIHILHLLPYVFILMKLNK